MAEKNPKRKPPTVPPDRMVDVALEMAEKVGWSALRLSDLADRLDVSTAEVLASYRDKDALADAWFRRALAAMLAAPPEDFAEQPAKDRLHLLLMRWFDALAGHRGVTGQMLREKLYPAHPHHWVPMIFNLSRTIQWLRDAARLGAPLLKVGGRRRQLEEVGLTLLFLATLRVWQADDTPGQDRTRAFLRKRLERADGTMARLYGTKISSEDKATTS